MNLNVVFLFGFDEVVYFYVVGFWLDFVNYVCYDCDVKLVGYWNMYGGFVFVNYLFDGCNWYIYMFDFWKILYYLFYVVKNGVILFI